MSTVKQIGRASGRKALTAIAGFCLVTALTVAAVMSSITFNVPAMGATSSTVPVSPVSHVQTQVTRLEVNHTTLEKRVEDIEAREKREKAEKKFQDFTASVERRFNESTTAFGQWWTEKRISGLEGRQSRLKQQQTRLRKDVDGVQVQSGRNESDLVLVNAELENLASRQTTLTSGLELRPTATRVGELIDSSEGRQDKKLQDGVEGLKRLSATIETLATRGEVKKSIADAVAPHATWIEASDTRIKTIESVNLQQGTAIEQVKTEVQKLLARFLPVTNVAPPKTTIIHQPACQTDVYGNPWCPQKR